MIRKLTLFLILIIIVVVSFLFGQETLDPGVIICDVGQGDGVIMITDSGKIILNDCGPDKSVMSCLHKEMGFWKKEIDVMIISHPHSDHFFGCFSVLEHYSVNKIFISAAPFSDQSYNQLINLAISKNIEVERANQSGRIIFSDSCQLEFLANDYHGDNLNNFSLGTRFVCAGFSFLSLGDLEVEEEGKLSDNKLSADIFKVSHHGSNSGNGLEFLQKIKPEVAVISVGKDNSYGHPAKATLDNLEFLGIKIWRTDKQGTFKFYSNIR